MLSGRQACQQQRSPHLLQQGHHSRTADELCCVLMGLFVGASHALCGTWQCPWQACGEDEKYGGLQHSCRKLQRCCAARQRCFAELSFCTQKSRR